MSSNSSVDTPDYNWASVWNAGKHVLVTGGTSGIGAAVSRAFLQAGASVHATGVSQKEIDALEGISDLTGADFSVLDVRNADDITLLTRRLNQLDVLVNCAGMIRRGEEFDPPVFEQVLNVNLTGSMRMCTASRSLLAASGGSIVNLASMLSFFGGGLVPAYAASKGGITQLTKSLAIAFAVDGIRVNAVAPGWIATPLTEPLREDEGRSGQILVRTPLNRWGNPEDVANAVLFLCSPAASFVTGSTLVVDGGYSIA